MGGFYKFPPKKLWRTPIRDAHYTLGVHGMGAFVSFRKRPTFTILWRGDII